MCTITPVTDDGARRQPQLLRQLGGHAQDISVSCERKSGRHRNKIRAVGQLVQEPCHLVLVYRGACRRNGRSNSTMAGPPLLYRALPYHQPCHSPAGAAAAICCSS